MMEEGQSLMEWLNMFFLVKELYENRSDIISFRESIHYA